MLIGITLSDLSRRSRWLLVIAGLTLLAALTMQLLASDSVGRVLQLWLLAVIALGLYWLSFLVDFRGRLRRGQMLIATLFALLPWVMVVVIVLGYPQLLLAPTAAT